VDLRDARKGAIVYLQMWTGKKSNHIILHEAGVLLDE
jgi:hypothetical protein